MADVAARLPAHTSAWRRPALVAAALAAFGVALSLADPGRVAGVQNFVLVFSSLLVEAIPFVLLGAVVSAAIEVFVPARAFERIATLPRALQLPAAGLGGLAFPVCECGSVPVARRLAAKGLSPGAAVTFMLAAPILNPVVLISTAVAYRGRDQLWTMVLGRAGLGLLAALAVGWVVADRSGSELLRTRPGDDHDHGHEHDESRPRAFFSHLAGDFTFMGRYLVLGAAVAATLQTFVPQSVIGAVAETPIVSLVALMALAFVLSLCSESDAFVAASFVQFGPAAQLAFLVFGPMVDTKLGFLYAGTFTRGFLRTVVVVVGAVTLAGTLWLEVLVG
ncbi:MAG TPA: permease [Actinomycetota bacterium]|nr:permease [Actinomycetota bacterium]